VIFGAFGLNFVRLMPTVRVGLHLPSITPTFVTVDFLLDSGATDSSLHPHDATTRLGINRATLKSPELWPNIQANSGVGGLSLCYLHPAIYGFQHDDGRFQEIEGEILVAQPTSTNSKIPCLLGWDILRFFRIELDYIGLRVTLR